MRTSLPLTSALVLSLLALTTACSGDDSPEEAAPGTDGGAGAPGDAAAPPLFAGRGPDETVSASGLSARVEVARDEYGVPHIYARNMRDAAYAQGYMHARDRFFQIDLYRHLIEGRLTEYFGSGLIGTDIANRSNMATTEGRPVFEVMAEGLDPTTREVLEAYAAGVNLYIAALKAGDVPVPAGYDNSLLADWSVDIVPEWRPADTLAIGRLQEQNLSDSTAADIARGQAATALPADLATDLLRYASPDPIAILPEFYQSLFYDVAGACSSVSECTASATDAAAAARSMYASVDFERTRRTLDLADPFGMERMPDSVEGSNNWVISGEHTDTGNAFVLNDPHLRFYNPSLFYHAHMDTAYYGEGDADSSIIGISFPGITGVLIGHNQHVAWGATTVGWDVSDVYVETLNAAGDAVLFNGAEVPIQQVTMRFEVLGPDGMTTEERVLEIVPHHGAIVPDSKVNGTALTRRWTGHEPVSSVDALLDRTSARNIDDFMESMSRFVAGAQNWNGADVDGNTGYMPGALIPIRESVTGNCNPTRPMDGTGGCEWTGFIPSSEVPRVKNRSLGYVVTANNDVTGTLEDNDPFNDPQYLHASNADGFRARRLTDRVEALIARGDVTRDEMTELQADTRSLEAERLMPFILAARDSEPALVTSLGLADALDRLASWDFTMPSGVDAVYRTDGGPDAAEIEASIAAAIYSTWKPRFLAASFSDEQAQYTASFNWMRSALYLLENPTTSQTGLSLFDDPLTVGVVETPDVQILTALDAALDFLASGTCSGSPPPDPCVAGLGANPDAWRWGALHQVEVQDLFGEFGVSFRTLGPFPRGGGHETVDVASTGTNATNFHYFAGPQMRFIAEVGEDGIAAASSLPGGQIDDPESPHYSDLLPLWLRNETFPLYFEPADVAAHVEELIVLENEMF